MSGSFGCAPPTRRPATRTVRTKNILRATTLTGLMALFGGAQTASGDSTRRQRFRTPSLLRSSWVRDRADTRCRRRRTSGVIALPFSTLNILRPNLIGPIKKRIVLCFLATFLLSHFARAEDSRFVVLAAGDIARCDFRGVSIEAGATARLLDNYEGTILALGDLAYPEGRHEEFKTCYGSTWGRHKQRTWPVPGNHEYRTYGAAGYFAYWGERAGAEGQGYYSLSLGSWHIIALNSNLKEEAHSEQLNWLRAELAATEARCILAFWHHPIFSSRKRHSGQAMHPAFEALYEAGASVVLAGHDHFYERFAPQDAMAQLDPRNGIRAFTVGTGGAKLHRISNIHPNSDFLSTRFWGILRLVLWPTSYEWDFLTVNGQHLDQGQANCVDRIDVGMNDSSSRFD